MYCSVIDMSQESSEPVSEAKKIRPKKKRKKVRRLTTPEIASVTDSSGKKEYFCEQNLRAQTKESSVTEHETLYKEWVTVDQQLKMVKNEWVAVSRQIGSVKSRLRVNAAVKKCPQIIEQKENYIPLNGGKSSTCDEPFMKSETNAIPHEQMNPSDSNYSIE